MVTENNLSTEAIFKNKILIQYYIQPQFNILHKQYSTVICIFVAKGVARRGRKKSFETV